MNRHTIWTPSATTNRKKQKRQSERRVSCTTHKYIGMHDAWANYSSEQAQQQYKKKIIRIEQQLFHNRQQDGYML